MPMWIITLALNFLMRQLERWGTNIDWVLFKADMKPRVEALVPGRIFDRAAVALVNELIDAVASVLSGSELQRVVDLLLQGKNAEALAAVVDLLKRIWGQSGVGSSKLHASVMAYDPSVHAA
jgi:hypothetical protein